MKNKKIKTTLADYESKLISLKANKYIRII